MRKGATLVELVIGLAILSMALSFTFPLWQMENPKRILAKEQHRLYLFLRQIQGRAENSAEIWLILANRHPITKHWCMTAQIKHEKRCDCFNPTTCPKTLYAHFYFPYFEGQTTIISPKLYPIEVARFNGIRNTVDANCFLLQAGEEHTLFSFFNVGSVKLKSNQSASACTR
ncbi:type II secretion system protein [Rodentibacter heidelbergensis]|uniref:Prepilin-type N-terminal cleavage/methylation domain-containing protein n=1 Tax=Rodentibacter heidelbergensis TaxID=1908258 RepID=A0A1V3ICP7_9PAST|nr:type II secretion system protein [Rodentibacter heidelbergensis]OOF37555.1 prepilin-type N-terminal cleavage/methylation domain-containing protein [Rodentibacter heidelbergensis]